METSVFKTIARNELMGQEYLAGWLDGEEYNRPDDRLPPYKGGREYLGFHETLYHTLRWYKPNKMLPRDPLTWWMDKDIVELVRTRIEFLLGRALGGPFDEYFAQYDPVPLSYYTAFDRKFQTITGSPIRSILDFGPGIGRQLFHWWYQWFPRTFYVVDAIESLYCLQFDVFTILFPNEIREYMLGDQIKQGYINHLPTWRMDLIPSGGVDLIIAVQVLQEINERALFHVLGQFKRIARIGTLLYIRDNEFWTPMHKIRVGRELLKRGWRLVFKYLIADRIDPHGKPRLWVYTGEDTRWYFGWKVRLARMLWPCYPEHPGVIRDAGLPI